MDYSLKFMMSGPPGTELFISSDMFFLEVLLEPTGVVKDVKIHHEGKNEQQVQIFNFHKKIIFLNIFYYVKFYYIK